MRLLEIMRSFRVQSDLASYNVRAPLEMCLMPSGDDERHSGQAAARKEPTENYTICSEILG